MREIDLMEVGGFKVGHYTDKEQPLVLQWFYLTKCPPQELILEAAVQLQGTRKFLIL